MSYLTNNVTPDYNQGYIITQQMTSPSYAATVPVTMRVTNNVNGSMIVSGSSVDMDQYGDSDDYPNQKTTPYIGSKNVTLGVGLYFRYIKKGLKAIQRQELEARLKKLSHIVVTARETSQQALMEEAEGALLVAAREQVLITKGYTKFVDRERVTKYLVQHNTIYSKPPSPDGVKAKQVYIAKLERFPRPIPAAVRRKLEAVRKLEVFDDFEVLYTDYTKEPEKKTVATRIREKDPILFGVMAGNPNTLYFVADWVDEYCDLTLSELADRYKPDKDEAPETIHTMLDMSQPGALHTLTQRVQARIKALEGTTRGNWRELEKRAIRDEAPPAPQSPPVISPETSKKKGFWGRFWSSRPPGWLNQW